MIAACPHWLVAASQFFATLVAIGGAAGGLAFILNRMGFE